VEQHEHVPSSLEEIKRQHGRLADTDFLPMALSMAVAYSEAAAHDPYLPPELLPRPWPGRAAREILLRSRRLALVLREESARPALFSMFDAAVLEQLS
jgi:phenylacetic acid degradation operon negative regulatory protein